MLSADRFPKVSRLCGRNYGGDSRPGASLDRLALLAVLPSSVKHFQQTVSFDPLL